MKIFVGTFALAISHVLAFSTISSRNDVRSLTTALSATSSEEGDFGDNAARRRLLNMIPAALLTSQLDLNNVFAPAAAQAATGAEDGNLPDLPPEAVRSYLQYRVALQIAADYYIFDLQPKVGDIEAWGEVQQLYKSSQARGGQGQPSKIERDFVNPMRVLLLSFPPDVSDEMRAAQFKFEKAMNSVSKVTMGYRRDLPVEIPASTVAAAQAGWEDGRVALNEFFALLNEATGLPELKAVPPAGQVEKYGRSARRYNDLIKKTKLCQNRGGPALSQGWGKLMVSGYLQDSCGIPDLDSYFYQ